MSEVGISKYGCAFPLVCFTSVLEFVPGAASAGFPCRAGEDDSLTTACGVKEVHQVLDLSGPSDGARGEPGRSAHVYGSCPSCPGGQTFKLLHCGIHSYHHMVLNHSPVPAVLLLT